MTDYNNFWMRMRHLLGRIRHEEDYKTLLKFFYNNQDEEEGFSYGELPDMGYSKLSKLENAGLIELTSRGSSGKMLVDLDIANQKPCFSRNQISEKVAGYGASLLEHAFANRAVMETVMAILGDSNVDFMRRFIENLPDDLIKFNQIVAALAARGISTTSEGYGRIEWRPRKAKRFALAKKYRD